MVVDFFNSNFFIAIVTLAVGLIAFGLYWRQKKDHKKDAANIILLEIQNAERILKRIKESLSTNTVPNELRSMQTESWSKDKYLFVRDFDRDEWDSVTDFYNTCELIDEAIRYNNSAFWNDVEQIRANKQRILASYAKEYATQINSDNKDSIAKEFEKATDEWDVMYMGRQGRFGYAPQRIIDDAKRSLDSIDINLSQTSIGAKLKKLSRLS